MKTIISKDELNKINPADLISYLKAKGWTQQKSVYNSLLIWTQKKTDNAQFEVLVPLETNFNDYTLRISDALNVLEIFEKRSAGSIYLNLINSSADVSGNEHLDVSMEWSLGRPLSCYIPNKVEFNKDFLPFIREAARTFKETKPIEEFELRGVVIRLESKDRKKSGEITVFGLLEGQQRKVSIKLEKSIYDIAIKAHQDGIPISCTGELKKQGNIYSLISPKNFILAENL